MEGDRADARALANVESIGAHGGTLASSRRCGAGANVYEWLRLSRGAQSVGAGGRYWAMWAPGNSDTFSLGCPCQTLPVRTERFGGLLQASYKLDGLK
jgi:hypothetical protein